MTKRIEDTYDAGACLGDILLRRLTDGEVDDTQKALLDQWLEENPQIAAQLEDVHDPVQLKVMIDRYMRIDASSERDYKYFLSLTSRRRPSRVLYYSISGVAAAILLTLSIIGLVHRTNHSVAKAPILASTQDRLPGTDKAVLTLSGGTTIVLDSARNGLIQQQGGVRVVNQAGGLLSYQSENVNHSPAQFNTITTGRGGQYRLVLSDGSKVWLDAVSSLRYPTAFNGKTREVTLTGQGYFEVAPGGRSPRPFIVRSSNTTVRVLGTSFNVNTYADEPMETTTLLDGSIQVLSGGLVRTLVPGEQAQVPAKGAIGISPANTDEVVAWKDGVFNFDNMSLYLAMRQIARWYDVNVVYEGKVPDKPILGYIPRNTKLSMILQLLSKVDVHGRIDGRTLTIFEH